MPGALTFSGAEYPLSSEANDVPADLLRFGDDIDHLLVLKATSEANRNSLYANVPAGTLVSCSALQTVWQKLTTPPTAASWATLLETSTVTSGVATAGTDFSVASQWARLQNGIISLKVQLIYGSGTEIVGEGTGATHPGNVSDTIVGTISSDWRPPVDWNAVYRSNVAMWNGVLITSTGGMRMDSGVPAGRLRTGDSLVVTATYPKT